MRALSFVCCATVAAVAVLVAPERVAGQSPVRPLVPVASFFPLEEGNWWEYGKRGPTDTAPWRVEVARAGDVGREQRSFQIFSYFFGAPRVVRSHPLDVITEYPHEQGPDTLWYLLGSSVGTSWELRLATLPFAAPEPACISGSRLTIAARNEVVRVPAGEFPNALRVDWEPPCVDAGITSEWFVPGVGLVKRVETSVAGPVTSELQSAKIGPILLPRLFYTTAITLDRPVYWNNLMPPVGPDAAPELRGSLLIRNDTDEAVELMFSGCRSITVEVRDDTGASVLRGRGDDGGCCQCESVVRVRLVHSGLTVPFALRLAQASGAPLGDGAYTVTATFDIVGTGAKPSASARIEVKSAY